MTTIDYPTHPKELTPEWLTETLDAAGVLHGSKVTGFSTEPVGEGIGMLGILVRVVIDYDKPAPDAPQTLDRQVPERGAGQPRDRDDLPAVRTRGQLLHPGQHRDRAASQRRGATEGSTTRRLETRSSCSRTSARTGRVIRWPVAPLPTRWMILDAVIPLHAIVLEPDRRSVDRGRDQGRRSPTDRRHHRWLRVRLGSVRADVPRGHARRDPGGEGEVPRGHSRTAPNGRDVSCRPSSTATSDSTT